MDRLEGGRLESQVRQVDLVLDCSDNFATRFDINRACVAAEKPLVSGAAIRFEGQLAVFAAGGQPCYQCLYPLDSEDDDLDQTCAENGVLASLVGVIGTLQASEAMKYLGGFGTSLAGKLVLHDALAGSWRELTLSPDPACPVCAAG
jgi:adenylyltransferase/sulfurtransferase